MCDDVHERLSYFQIIGSLVEVHGHMYFIDNGNVGVDGGAIYSTSLGQIQLANGSRVRFDGNAGK